jgi:hypothetical protein
LAQSNEKSGLKKTLNEEIEKDGGKAAMEAGAVRTAREKAEWKRLSFVEKIVKKFLPSHINSIVIFVNKNFLFPFLKNFISIRLFLVLGMLSMNK